MEGDMNHLATTRLSSKGQIIIPEEIRNQLKLHPGDQFIVIAEKDVVILKTISLPNRDEFSELIAKARDTAKKTGLKEKDVQKAIQDARKK